ncbi:MAG TPA: hypothetical protein VF763_12200 [Candidatus Limnocylindrales bacterium]
MTTPLIRRGPAARARFASLALLSVLGLLLVLAGPALAARAPAVPTQVTFNAPNTAVLGTDVPVDIHVSTTGGAPVPDLRLVVAVDGKTLHSGRSDAAGHLLLTLKQVELPKAATLTLTVAFDGTAAYGPSSASQQLTIVPAAVTVTTVPAVEGLAIDLGSSTTQTDANGVAAFPIPAYGTYQLAPHLDTPADAGVRVSFLRWQDDVYTAARSIRVTGKADYILGLRVVYRGSVRFVGLDGRPVDPALVTSADFTNAAGTSFTLSSFGAPVWWEAALPVRRAAGLVASPTIYRVTSVTIAGTNVVNQGQQAWTPTLDGTWTIQVLLYGLTVHTQDAIFGSPVQGRLDLVYPDGQVRETRLGPDGMASFDSLPRGTYELRLHASAITPPTPVALSRPQEASVRVLTYFDIAFVGGVLLLIVLVLFAVGRRRFTAALLRASGRRLGATPGAVASSGQRVAGGVRVLQRDLDALLNARPATAALGPAVAPRVRADGQAPPAGLRPRDERTMLAIAGGVGLLVLAVAGLLLLGAGLPGGTEANVGAGGLPSVAPASQPSGPNASQAVVPADGASAIEQIVLLDGRLDTDTRAMADALRTSSGDLNGLSARLRAIGSDTTQLLAAVDLLKAWSRADSLRLSLASFYGSIDQTVAATLRTSYSDPTAFRSSIHSILGALDRRGDVDGSVRSFAADQGIALPTPAPASPAPASSAP